MAFRPRLGGPQSTCGEALLSLPAGAAPPRIEVAAGLLLSPDGRVLLARRPAGKPYAGYWEFPGGKAEPGESLAQALARELTEELGVRVQRAYPWLLREHVYPHGHVRLHFFRVLQWTGEPQPHEAQELDWQPCTDIRVSPLLPANSPVLAALRLPHRLLITRTTALGEEAQMARLDRALATGEPCVVMLREPDMEAASRAALATRVVQRCHAAGALVVINEDLDAAYRSGADGVHLKARQLAQGVRPEGFELVGASCHNREELDRAADQGLEYALLGPVLPTATHPDSLGLGWARTAELLDGVRLPVFLLGGLDPAHLTRAWECGAHGVALMRKAWPAA